MTHPLRTVAMPKPPTGHNKRRQSHNRSPLYIGVITGNVRANSGKIPTKCAKS